MNDFLKDTITTISTTDEPRAYEKILVNQKSFHKTIPYLMESDDELFLIIDNNPATISSSGDGSNSPSILLNSGDGGDTDSGVQIEYRQYVLNKKLNFSQNAKNIQQMQSICMINDNHNKCEETPKRKLRSKQYYNQLRHNSLNKRLPTPHSSIFQKQHQLMPTNRLESIQKSITDGLYELNALIQYEQNLVANLSKCCAQYRAQNQMYTTKLGLEMCIEEIQGNLDYYSKEIVDTEFQLFKTQMEINQKQSVLMNLQRMLKNEKSANGNRYIVSDEKMSVSNENEIDFVDNIYEFCDNNKSMIV